MSDLPPTLKELARIYTAIMEQRLLAQLREKWLAAGGELPTPAPSSDTFAMNETRDKEIVRRFTKTKEPVPDIARAFKLSPSRVYQIVWKARRSKTGAGYYSRSPKAPE